MISVMKKQITSFFKNRAFWFVLALSIFELVYVTTLFGGTKLLAGGDHYTYLNLLKTHEYFSFWTNNFAFGNVNPSIADGPGIPAYALFSETFGADQVQRAVIYVLYLLKAFGFYKLIKYFFKEINFPLLLATSILYLHNVFEALNPFSFFNLLYNAYLPLSLYFFLKLVNSKKFDFRNIAILIVLSLVFVPINSNPALGVTIFVPQLLYIALSIRKIKKIQLINLGTYYSLLLLTSLWWIMPLAYFYLETAGSVFGAASFFEATKVGQTFLNLRFLGQWGWYQSNFLYDYYPFSEYYDAPHIVLISYSFVAIAFYYGIRTGKKGLNNLYLISLGLLSLLLVGGAREPFGFLYALFYKYLPVFKIFREPFTKFGEVYVLAFALLLYLGLTKINKRIVAELKPLFSVAVIVLVLVSNKPVLFGEHVWSLWNGNTRSSRVAVPDYWMEFRDYANDNLSDGRLLSLPRFTYGGAWNWKYGFTSADDIAISFVPGSTEVLRAPLSYGAVENVLLAPIYEQGYVNDSYLSLLGVTHILQVNDRDWRYADSTVFTPDKIDSVVSSLPVVEEVSFGEFTENKLSEVTDNSPNANVFYELRYYLEGRPAIKVYELDPESVKEKIYSPTKSWALSGEVSDVYSMSLLEDFEKGQAVYVGYEDSLGFIEPDYIYKVAQRNDQKLDVNNIDWDPGWLWPKPSVDPSSFEYKILQLLERFELYRLRKDPKLTLEKHIWFGAKRATEASIYDLDVEARLALVDEYYYNMEIVTSDLMRGDDSTVPEGEYWGLILKTLAHMDLSNGYFTRIGLRDDHINSPYKLYDEFLEWAQQHDVSQCLSKCFSVEPSASGEYSVYLKSVVPQVGTKVLVSEKDSGQGTEFNATESNGKEWINLGEVNLLKDKLYAVTFNHETKNLIPTGEWSVFTSVQNEEDFEISFLPFNQLPEISVNDVDPERKEPIFWDSQVRYKNIDQWEPYANYKISFDYFVLEGGLGVSIVEQDPDFESLYKIGEESDYRKAVFNKAFTNNSTGIRSKICDDDFCLKHYEKTILSGKNAKSGQFYVYAFPQGGNIASVSIKNVRVERLDEPEFAIVKETEVSQNDILEPVEISNIEQVSATKFTFDAANLGKGSQIIFQERFHDGWELFAEDGSKLQADHIEANGYANSWIIEDFAGANKGQAKLIIEFKPQNTLNILLGIATFIYAVSFVYFVVQTIINFVKKNEKRA